MMRWLQSLGPESRSLNEIHSQFLEMMVDGRHVFDAAANALLGGTAPEVIRDDLFATDRRINRTEQAIRREIVVHGSIYGAATFPALLVMMRLVKDAERIGDYAKNLYGLAAARPPLGGDAERKAMIDLKDRVSKLIVRAHGLFESQNDSDARAFLEEVHQIEGECDAQVDLGLHARKDNASARVLAHRYFKRVTSHTGNIVSSLVVPLDKLDYFDEPRPKGS